VELLRLLSNTAGAPGFEEPIRKVMVDQMRPYATSITFDGMGSIIATQATTGPRIMVDAHMDELGGMVPADERTRVYPRDSLFLDVGASSEAEVRAMGISVGDPIVPDAPFEVLNGTERHGQLPGQGLGRPRRLRSGGGGDAAAGHHAPPQSDHLRHHDPGRDRPARRAHRIGRHQA